MAETYTHILKLKQPQVGASTNTWGNTLNVDITAIDQLYQDRGGRNLTSDDINSDVPGEGVHAYDYSPAYKGESSNPTDENYVDLASTMFIRVRIDKDNDGAISINYDNKGTRVVRKFVDGKFVHVEKGDLPKNHFAEFVYTTSVLTDDITEPNAPNQDGWILLNPAPSTVIVTQNIDISSFNQLCAHRNLTVEATDDLHLTVKADTVVLRTAQGTTKTYSGGISVPLDIKQAGAGGLHGFGLAANAWYTIYLIGKAADNTISGILSPTNGGPGPAGGKWTGTVSSVNTVPPLPSGYSFYGFVGCARTRAGTGGEDPIVLVDFHQAGNMVSIRDDAGQPANRSSVNYSAVTLALCPPEALSVRLGVQMTLALAGPSPALPVAVEARLAPQGSGTTFQIGEIVVQGAYVLWTQVTMGLRVAGTVYARSPTAVTSTTLSDFQIRVHGFSL